MTYYTTTTTILKMILQMLEKQRQFRKKWMVDSTFTLQKHKRLTQFQKSCLNLCFRWLSPTLRLVRSFNQTGLYTLKYGLGTARTVFNRASLENNRLLALHTCRSKLFDSEIVNGKKEYLKRPVSRWYVCEASVIQLSIARMISLKNIFWQCTKSSIPTSEF